MDPKLTLVFLLVGAVIALSNLDDATLDRVKDRFDRLSWRGFVPGRRKS
ncbi:MAG: hypothetical protein WA792_06965 [Pseudolabrys sp.]